LVHRDYVQNRQKILSLRSYFITQSQSEPFYTEFDYTVSEVRISVLPAKPFIARLPVGPIRLEAAYQLQRKISYKHRMSLDIAVVPEGKNPRYWILQATLLRRTMIGYWRSLRKGWIS
jgi:hypothetical protein